MLPGVSGATGPGALLLPGQLSLPLFDAIAIQPALTLLPPEMRGTRATAMLLAIALQETKLQDRVQRLNSGRPGPAHGYWQFERAGGCAEVLSSPRIAAHTQRLCRLFHIDPTALHVWNALIYHDVFAAACARLLLWLDPQPLPTADLPDVAWALYLRRWRPGKPHVATWPAHYARAWGYVQPKS